MMKALNLKKFKASVKSVMIAAIIILALIPALFIWMLSDYPSNYYHNFDMVLGAYLMVGIPYVILGTGLVIVACVILSWFIAKTISTLLKVIGVIIMVSVVLTSFVSLTLYLVVSLAFGATG